LDANGTTFVVCPLLLFLLASRKTMTTETTVPTSGTSSSTSSYYEQLGAPVLLYRNRECYTVQDDDAALLNASSSSFYHQKKEIGFEKDDTKTIFPETMTAADLFYDNQAKLMRCTARWYYPMDYHIVRSGDFPLGRELYPEWRKVRKQPQNRNERRRMTRNRNNHLPESVNPSADENENDDDENYDEEENQDSRNEDDDENDSDDPDHVDQNNWQEPLPRTRGRNGIHITQRVKAQKRAFRNKAFADLQTQRLQLEARAHMLLTNHPNDNNDDHNNALRTRHQARIRWRDLTQLDANYVPAIPLRIHNTEGKTGFVYGITNFLCQQTQQYDRQRMDRSDPAYLAPFSLPVLQEITRQDIIARGVPMYAKQNIRRHIPGIKHDDPNAPNTFGNCLCSFPCECGVCRSSSNPVMCVLHPVGALQDRVRLSFLQFPNTRDITEYELPRKGIPEEINVGDRVRQIQPCGRDPLRFVARTSIHWTVFSVRFVQADDDDDGDDNDVPGGGDACWGAIELRKLHRIDHRTLWKGRPSFRPLDVTCHPNYGVGVLTDPRVAVLYESQTKERNILHHVQIGAGSVSVQKVRVANLQEISQIEFSSHHPMVLWAAARSYVRPALTHGYQPNKKPRIGNGHSLFSVDLRQRDDSMATFQWSPSAEEFVPENIHSISGIFTDWSRDHSLFVASISAFKTWEIDTRMPCQSIQCWSLPHFCDDLGPTFPSTGFYGGGTLFSMPVQTIRNETQSSKHLPIFCVGKSTGVHSIHALQRPVVASSLFTKPVEMAMGPDPSPNCSVVKCGAFALPDVSDKIFTCGLTSFSVPSKHCLHETDLSNMKCEDNELVVTISLTSKGDMYAHSLLESCSTRRRSKAFPGFPVGTSIIPATVTPSTKRSSWNVLKFVFSNQLPVPSQSISRSTNRPSGSLDTIDLSKFAKQSSVKRRRSPVSGNEDVDEICDDEDECNFKEEISRPPKLPVVVSRPSVHSTIKLTLSPRITKNTAEGHSTTIEHFMPINSTISQNAHEIWRSDLTPDVLKKAEEDDEFSANNDKHLKIASV
jgi:hypothetical protein